MRFHYLNVLSLSNLNGVQTRALLYFYLICIIRTADFGPGELERKGLAVKMMGAVTK